MSILGNPVLISVAVMIVLCLLKLNIIIAIIVAALVGGLVAGMDLSHILTAFIGGDITRAATGNVEYLSGMGGNAETALSYILLGALAFAIQQSGVATMFGDVIERTFGKNAKMLLFALAIIACFSQNLVPVHIAFIPILIPPLLGLFNKLKIDRRAVACSLTFGLKAPYILIPAGFGSIFQTIIAKNFNANISGTGFKEFDVARVPGSVLIPVIGMFIGLLIALFFSYSKPREYKDIDISSGEKTKEKFSSKHLGAVLGAVTAFGVDIILKNVVKVSAGSLPMGALLGLLVMMVFGTFKLKELDNVITQGIYMMGFIAFVMLVAAGYGTVIRETGGVDMLVKTVAAALGGNKLIGAIVLLFIGLLITMGIGTSFGTTPIIATIYVPLCYALGFSAPATICLIAVAAALGDAGSPASDTTLGPTSGLNADGQHDHIWDTCVPTFLHFNIPLMIFGTVAAMIL